MYPERQGLPVGRLEHRPSLQLAFPEEGASGVATSQSMEGRDHIRVRAQFVVEELNVESRLAKLEARVGRYLGEVSEEEDEDVSVRRNYGCLHIFVEQGEMIYHFSVRFLLF